MQGHERARAWLAAAELGEVSLEVPDLIWPESAHAILRYVRAGTLSRADADLIVSRITRFPADVHALRELLPAAWAASAVSRLSVYDSCYLVLARAARATLVTFDTDFDGLYERLELLA